MPLLWCSTLVMIAAPPAAADGQQTGAVTTAVSASIDESLSLRDEVRAALREARTSATKPPTEASARRLLDVYRRLQVDESLRGVERQRLLGTVRSRLARIADALDKDRQRQADRSRREERSVAPRPAGVQLPPEQDQVLAQQPAAPPGGFPIVPQAPAAGASGGAAPDFGPDLVQLIQETIAPPTWDVNGGPGTVYYYRPPRVLVIRQTSEVHGQLRGVLGQLRRN
jgi:hypothetical protein